MFYSILVDVYRLIKLKPNNVIALFVVIESKFCKHIIVVFMQTNTNEVPNAFDRATVARQLRALEVLETLNLMTSGTLYL